MFFSSTQSVGKQQLSIVATDRWFQDCLLFLKKNTQVCRKAFQKQKPPSHFLQIMVVEPCCVPTCWKFSFSVFIFRFQNTQTPLELRMHHFWGMLSLFSCTGGVFYSQNVPNMILRRVFLFIRNGTKVILSFGPSLYIYIYVYGTPLSVNWSVFIPNHKILRVYHIYII